MSNMAEKSVIGCLLMDINSIKYIYGKLKADMFFDPVYKDAYSEILKGYDLGNPKNVNLPGVITNALITKAKLTNAETNIAAGRNLLTLALSARTPFVNLPIE